MLTVTNVAASVLIVRTLGSEGRGLYSVANSIVAIFTIVLNLGLPWSNTYFASRNRDRVPVIFMNSFFYSCIMLISAGILLGLARPLVSALLRKQIPESAVEVLIFLIPAVAFFQMINSIILGMNRVIFYTQLNFFIYLAFLLYSVICVSFGIYTKGAMLWMLLFAYVTVGLMAARKILKYYRVRLRFNASYLSRNVRSIGFRAQTVNLMGAVMQRADVLIINYFLGLWHAGFYSLAMLAGQLIYQLPSIMGNILFPLSASGNGVDDTRRKMIKLSHFLIFFILVIYVATLAFGRTVLVAFYGTEFSACLDLLLVMYPGLVFCSLSIVVNSFLAGRGYPKAVFASSMAGITTCIAGNAALVPWMGITGSALVFTASYAIMFAILAAHLSRHHGIRPLDFFLIKREEYSAYLRYIVDPLSARRSEVSETFSE